MASEHRRARRAAGVVVTVLVALAGGLGLLLFFVARDDAPVEREAAGGGATTVPEGPGVAGDASNELPARDRARLVRALEAGNVVLVYGARGDRAGLESLAEDVAGGPPDRALERAGQSVLVARRRGTRGVVGLAHRRILRVPSPADPELRRFADAWLGRGAGG